MRLKGILYILVFIVLVTIVAAPCFAELQNVRIGGEVRVRGNYWMDSFNTGFAPVLVGPSL